MPGHDELDFERLDYWSLTGAQWEALRWHVAHRAERKRAQALRALFRGMWSALRAGATAAAEWWRGYAERRRLRQAMAELQGFSDRELKDVGVRRSEIYWVVHHGRVEPPPRVTSPPTASSEPDSIAAAAGPRGNDQISVAA